ncbi:MAG: Hsp20/alpha crystallin family protein [Candidatus Aminicenantaceae bacterium]
MVRRIKPVSRIAKIEAEINRIIGEVFFRKKNYFRLDEVWVPRIDIYENENRITIETEIPGVSQKDITILLHNNRIEIRGVKREVLPGTEIRYFRLEREYGNFSRVISLPSTVIPEKTKATFENGVLTISMKKLRKKREKGVTVQIQETGE